MIPPREKEKVRELIKETLTLLCKNGLSFSDKCTIEAVIGITMDGEDVLLVSMNELIRSEMESAMSPNKKWSQKPNLVLPSEPEGTSSDIDMLARLAGEEVVAKKIKCDAGTAEDSKKISHCNSDSNSTDLTHAKHQSNAIVIKEEITDEENWIVSGIQVSDPESPSHLSEDRDALSTSVALQPGQNTRNPLNVQGNVSDSSQGKSRHYSEGNPLRKMGFMETWSRWVSPNWTPQSQQTPYTCNTCGKSYKTKDYLQRHEKSHDTSLVMCKKCTQFFPNRELYDMHVEMKHGEMERKHICAICGKGFNRVQYLYRHIGMHEKQIARNSLFGMAYASGTDQSLVTEEGQETV